MLVWEILMPRIRSIKPEFWSDEKIGTLSFMERLAFIGLWNYADDEGRARFTIKGLNGFLFPHDTVSDKDLSAALAKFHDLHLLTLYDVDGMPHYQITNWSKHQRINRPAASLIVPPIISQGPLEHSVNNHGVLTEQSLRARKEQGAGSREQGTGNREARFARFWSAWPKKVDKQAALKAFHRLDPSDELLDEILHDVDSRRSCVEWTKEGGKYIPNPATYLNGERWTDEGVDLGLLGNNGHKPTPITDMDGVTAIPVKFYNLSRSDGLWHGFEDQTGAFHRMKLVDA